jgi:small-conductance mechanosensitive channel
MVEELLKAASVFLLSMLKFILGPMTGLALGLHFVTTTLATIGGMMMSVVIFTYFGEWLRAIVLSRFYRYRKKFTRRTRRIARWRKYGLTGIAALTPLVLTPIGGTLLAVGATRSKGRILLAMMISASSWSLIFTSVIYFFGSDYFPAFMKWIFENAPPNI